MSGRRITTPQDLGAAIRDARIAAGLTQARLAENAGVSREWLIGFERGVRPRAELTKVLSVLSALGRRLSVSGDEDEDEIASDTASIPADGGWADTAEITRRAVERSRRRSGSSSAATIPPVAPVVPVAPGPSTALLDILASLENAHDADEPRTGS